MVAVKITHLSKTYQGYRGFLKRRRVQALQQLDLEILKGEVLGLLGLNAAGKTTVLKILMGLIQPTKGEFKILGKRGIDKETRRKIGYLPENANLYEFLTASEFLNFCGKLFSLKKDIRQKKVAYLLRFLDLEKVKSTRISEFSKGMRQRLAIASALINEPQLIFLDEPLSGLDPLGRKKVKEIIRQLNQAGSTIFFSSHILAEVEEICHRIGILHQGRLICLKSIQEIKKEGVSLEDFFIKMISSDETTLLSDHHN